MSIRQNSKIKVWFSNLPIAKKIYIINIIVIVALITIFITFINKVSTNIIISKTIDSLIQNHDLVNHNISVIIDRVDDISRVIVANDQIQEVLRSGYVDDKEKFNWETKMNQILDNIIEPRSAASSVVIYGKEGQILTTSRIRSGVIDTSSCLRKDEYLEALSKGGTPIWINTHPIDYQIEKKRVNGLTLLRAIISTSSADIIGVLEINVNESIIADAYLPAVSDSTKKFFIVDTDGVIVSSIDENELYESVHEQEYFKWALKKDRSGDVFKINGKEFVLTVSIINKLDALLIGMVPLRELTAENKKITQFLIIIGILFIIVSGLLSIYISNTITSPISHLAQIMGDAGQGDLEVRAPVTNCDEVGILSSTFNKMIGQISDLMEQVFWEQKHKKKLELFALQAQIKPHFLYNTLDSICTLAQMGKNDDVFRMVKSLALFYRTGLSKGRNIITIKEELDNVRHYLTIQKVRYFDKFNYFIECDSQILDKNIVKLSVQPLVENAIYHGIKNKKGMGMIKILAGTHGDKITISVIDDSGNFDMSKLPIIFDKEFQVTDETSFGLRNVDERLKLYFGKQYGLNVFSIKGEYTRVDIVLPTNWGDEDDKDINS